MGEASASTKVEGTCSAQLRGEIISKLETKINEKMQARFFLLAIVENKNSPDCAPTQEPKA